MKYISVKSVPVELVGEIRVYLITVQLVAVLHATVFLMRENTYQHDRQVHIIQLGGERQTGRQKQTDRDRQADRITKGSNIILDIVMYIKINSKQICC